MTTKYQDNRAPLPSIIEIPALNIDVQLQPVPSLLQVVNKTENWKKMFEAADELGQAHIMAHQFRDLDHHVANVVRNAEVVGYSHVKIAEETGISIDKVRALSHDMEKLREGPDYSPLPWPETSLQKMTY